MTRQISSNWLRSSVFGLALLASCFGWLVTAGAAGGSADDTDYPLVVINVASIQRLRDNAGAMFESAARAEMSERVDQFMANTLKETKGIDRNRPLGTMLYLNPVSIGTPMGISYVPVLNLDEALETLAYGVGTILPVEGKRNQHEIQYSESFKLRTLYQDGYLFMVGPDGDSSALDRNFPDPEKLTTRLTAQYDIAASLLIKSIPSGMKTAFLILFKSQMTAALQQRDDEPESVYRLRRANGEVWIDLVEKVLNQGNEVTLGARMDGDQKVAYIDFEISGTKDSKLAKFFQNMAGKKTYFGNLLTNPSTFTLSASWLMEEKQRKLFVTYFEAAQKDLSAKIEEAELDDLAKIIDPLFKTLVTSADIGHLDAIAQLTGTEPEEFAMLAGIKLATSSQLPKQIEETLQYLKDNPPNENELITQLDLNFDYIDSHPVHRLPIDPPDNTGRQLFGEHPNLYVYASPQAIWCAFGGEAALESLKEATQAVATPQDPRQNRNRIPLMFVTHARNWLNVGADDDDADAVRFHDRAEASFESDNDAMRIEIKPTDSGVRIRTEFEQGFIGLLGRGIAQGIDDGVFNRPPGGEGRRRGRNRQNPAPAEQDN